MRNGFPQPSTHRKQSEIVIIWIFSIVAAGLAALYSASSFIGYRDFNDPNFYVQKQFFMILIGATVLYISSKISLKSLQEVAPFLYPSYLCYGYQGDDEKVDINQPLRFTIKLVSHLIKN